MPTDNDFTKILNWPGYRVYDVAKHSIVRLLWGLAQELREHNIATVALAPGFMRTERVMSHASGEADWKEDTVAE